MRDQKNSLSERTRKNERKAQKKQGKAVSRSQSALRAGKAPLVENKGGGEKKKTMRFAGVAGTRPININRKITKAGNQRRKLLGGKTSAGQDRQETQERSPRESGSTSAAREKRGERTGRFLWKQEGVASTGTGRV